MKNELTAKRLQEAMNDNGIINGRTLAELSGIKEQSVSQYINGSHAPSNVSSKKMGEVLGVNPVWLMGYDVPKYARDETLNLGDLTDEEFAQLKAYYEFIISRRKKQ